MKNHKFNSIGVVLTLLVALSLLIGGCNKDDNKLPVENYAKFSKPEATVKGDEDSISVGIRWALSEWSISTKQDGIITGFSRTTGGGGQEPASGFVVVRLKPNLGEQNRSQEIIIKALSTGVEEKMVITQSPASGSDKYILNPAVKYQKITGFGGMINPSWTGNTQLSVEDIDKLYGPGGLGLNIGRLMLYPSASGWSREVAVAKRAQQYGALLFASPWTPPTSMKSVNVNHNKNGEYLLPENYAAFAAHLKSYVDYYKAQGVDIYAVSIQNEPDYKVDYDGCSYSVPQMLDFVKKQGRSVGTRLIAGEMFQYNKAYTDALLNDATAVNNFDIVGSHLYGFNFSTTSGDYPLARDKNKEVWMTEHLFNSTANGIDWLWNPSIKGTLAEELHDCMKANFNAYIYWYIKRYYGLMGETRDTNNPADWYTVSSGEITKRGYIMSHYAKYATGRTRIDMNVPNSSSILTTAYEGANDYTVILTNKKDTPVIIDIVSPKNIVSASVVETNAEVNMSNIDYMVDENKKSLKLRMSANSIVSVKINL